MSVHILPSELSWYIQCNYHILRNKKWTKTRRHFSTYTSTTKLPSVFCINIVPPWSWSNTTFSPLCVSQLSDPPSTAPLNPGQKREPTVSAAALCTIALSRTLGEMLVVRGPAISIISQRRSRLNYQHGCVQTGAQLITLGWSPCCLCPRSATSQLTTWRFIGANGSARGNYSEKLSSSALPFLTLSAPSGVAVTGQTHFTVRCITPVPPLVGMLRCASARLLLMIIAFFILGNQWGPLGDAQTCSVAPFFFICAICARVSILVGASGWELVQKQGDKQKLSISIHLSIGEEMKTPPCRWLVKLKGRKKKKKEERNCPRGLLVQCAAIRYAFIVGHASFSGAIKIF